jgi:hypothetical protein
MTATPTPTSDLTSFLGPNAGINRLYDNVQAVVPSVGLPLVQMEAWNAIEEFYLISTVRREFIYWQMAPGVAVIDLNPFDANWLVQIIHQVWGLAFPKVEPPSIIRDLNNAANATTNLRQGRAIVSLKPASFNVGLDPQLFAQWFEVILDGTLFRLYAQPSKPFSNAQLAMYHGKRFRAGMARARILAEKLHAGTGPTWAYPYFARGRRPGGAVVG